jgi:lipopolysaccharide/colanic/teichoic acid biosynthesis glycosyltransferase
MPKRILDAIVAGAALLVFAPVMLVLTAWIALDSRGGVLYRGERAGRNNRPFRMLKFRTMVRNAEKVGGPTTSFGDPRVTASGRFLRRFKLDELPQLINVLVGDMSLVGPRPQVLSYTQKYEGEFREILSVRPGITDWATIWNANEGEVLEGAVDVDRAYDDLINPTKLRLQLHYVRTQSVATDLRILYCTLRRMFDPDFYPPELAGTPRLRRGAGASVSPMTSS